MEKENKVDWEWFNQLPSLSICDAVTLSLGYELMSFAPADFDMSSRNIEAPTEYRQRLFLTYQHAINDKLKRTGRTASIDEPYNQDAQFSDGQFWEIDLADFRRFCDDKKWAVPAEFLPEGYVVPAAIPTEEKPIGTRERNTLLTIIAVLCKEAKLDHNKPAKTAGLIQSTAEGMGIQIGETTIEGYLKKINNALESRTK